MLCLALSLQHLKCHKEHVIVPGPAEAWHRTLRIAGVCVVWRRGWSGILTSGEITMWGVELIEVLMCCDSSMAHVCVRVCACMPLYLLNMPPLKCFCLLWKLINTVNTFAIPPQSSTREGEDWCVQQKGEINGMWFEILLLR